MAQKLNTKTSIVDYLKSKGQDSSMQARTQLANKQGISNYTGTAKQNIALLKGSQAPAPKVAPKVAPKPVVKAPTNKVTSVKPKVTAPAVKKTTPAKTATPVKTTATPRQEAIANETKSMEDALTEYKDFLKKQTDSSYDSQKALLDSANTQRLAELKKALDRAIADGELNEEEANKQFAENVDAINEDAYTNSQATELSAQQRGIGNSQQMLAMQQGDQRHQSELTNDSRTARDDRISSIRQKITQITNENALDVSTSNQTHNNSLASARAQADAQFASGMSQMNMEQYKSALQMKNNLTMQEQAFLDEMEKMEKQQGYNRENMKLGHQYELDKMKQGQEYTQDNMRLGQIFEQDNMKLNQKYTQANMDKQQKLDLSKMSVQQKYGLETLAKQHGYDLTKMNASQLHEFNVIAKQHGYAKEMTGINHSFESSMQQNQFAHQKDMNAEQFNHEFQKMQKQFELDKSAELSAYDKAVERKLAGLTPGTSEYDITQGQLAQEREALIQEQHTSTSYDAISKQILEGQTTKPKKPKAKQWWKPQSIYDGEMKRYNEQLKEYNKYQEYLKNPSSAFP